MPEHGPKSQEPVTVEMELVRLRNEIEIAHALQLAVLVKVAARFLNESEDGLFDEIKRDVAKYRVISTLETRSTRIGE